MVTRARWCFLAAVFGVLLVSGVVWGQSANRGTITGVITDPAEAVVPEVKVTVRNLATGIETSTLASSTGSYTIPFLPLGSYVLTAEKTGFKQFVQTGITVSVGTTLTLNLRLEIGEISQKVEVTGEAPLLQASTSELGTVVDNRTYTNLPLSVAGNRRDPVNFIFLAPGVTGNSFSTQINGGVTFSKELWVGGAPTSPFEIQGDHRTIQNGMSVEAVNEFKLTTNNYSADMGKGSGVVQFEIKSGTNQFHGALYEYLRNEALDARGFFAPSKPRNRQHEFGGNVGGPVKIPGLYDGKERTFFFFDFNAYRNRPGASGFRTTLPAAQMRTGDFRGIAPIYDPITKQRVSCNGVVDVICPDRISSISKKFLEFVPTPTLPGLVNNHIAQAEGAPFNNTTGFTTRVDHRISDKQNLAISYNYGTLLNGGGIPNNGITGPLANIRNGPSGSTMIRVSHIYTLRPNLVNSFTYGFNRDPQATVDPQQGTAWPERLGLRGVRNVTMPGVIFTTDGLNSWHESNNTEGFQIFPNSNVFQEQLSWNRGKHNFKFGFDIRRFGENFSVDSNAGEFFFSQLATSLPGTAGTGHAFASFLLGAVNNASQRIRAAGRTGDRAAYWAGYVQDDWKVTPKLTLNLGLRYDFPYGRTEVANRLSSMDPNLPNPGAGNIPGALVFAGSGAGTCNCTRFTDFDYKEFGPRFGFAYQVDSKTVLRGGYGIFYIGGGNLGGNAQRGNPIGYTAFPAVLSPDAGITPAFYWDNGFPQNFRQPPLFDPSFANGGGITWTVREYGQAPQYQNWNLNLQREISSNFQVSAAYAGSKGTRLPSGIFNPNQVDSRWLSLGPLLGANINSPQAQAAIAAGTIPGPRYPGFSGSVGQNLRRFPQYTGVGVSNAVLSFSNYHSFQLELRKRFSTGLHFLVAYTASKTLDNSGSLFGGFFGASGRDHFNQKLEKSLSVNDIPQNLVVNYVYELPFGKGKKLVNRGGVAGRLAEGWQVSGVHLYRSGTPIEMVVNNTLALFNQRNNPNRVLGVSPRSSVPIDKFDVFGGRDRYINPAAFAEPAPFTIGNGPRTYGDLRQPNFYNEDFSVIKRTYIRETVNVEFRWEMYNLFNRTVFSVGGTNFSNLANLGTIGGQANSRRQMQFGIKINY